MKILIADDDVLIRKWLGLLIRQAEEYETVMYQAENGKEALEVIRTESIDLLITDIKMPVVDGVELIGQARLIRPDIRIVVLSAYDDYNYVRTTLKSGVLDYLLKAEMDLEDIYSILHTVEQDIFLENTMEQDDKEQLLSDCLPNAELFRSFWEDESKSACEFLARTRSGLVKEHLFLSMVSIDGRGKLVLSHSKIIVIISNILKGKSIRNVVLPYYNDHFIILYNSRETVFEKQKEENGLLMTYMDVALKRYLDCRIQYNINVRLHHLEELRDKIREEEQVLLKKLYYQKNDLQMPAENGGEEAFVKRYSQAIEKGMMYIDEHCTEKISLEQVANEVFLNKNYFSELFKKEVGMNYNDYLNEARIRKSCTLMEEGAYSLSQIAQMTGFSDQNYFAKIFKKVTGQTPMSYKKKLGM